MKNYFPSDYITARAAFRACAADVDQQTCPIDVPGTTAGSLSIDSAYFGSRTPRQLVVITSGIHGVEGYAGSALQQLWMAEFSGKHPAGIGVLLVHALNPYGFMFGRRTNEHNVDLNRNALITFPGPANPAYHAINSWLNPSSPAPRLDDFFWRALPPLLRHRRAALAQTVAAGQYEFPEGLFYGGREREPSLAIFSNLLSAPCYAGVRRVWQLDLHTGLGRFGQYQLLLEEPPTSLEFEHFVRGFEAQTVKSNHGSDVSHYSAHGILSTITRNVFPGSQHLAATVEFGTYGPTSLLRHLRAENRVHHHGATCSSDAVLIRKRLRESLAPHSPAWRNAVIAGGRRLFTRFRTLLDEPWHG